MNRSTLSLIGVTVVLAAITGLAGVTGSGTPAAVAPAGSGARMPVERSTLVCPAPSSSDFAETVYTSFSPGGGPEGEKGAAGLLPAGKQSPGAKPVVPLTEPGRPTVATVEDPDAPALIGTADGKVAPGWTVQQTTVIDAGDGRGLIGMSCTAPDSDFWIPGASTAQGRQDYVHLTNPDDSPAVVDLKLYGVEGPLKTVSGDNLTVPAHSSVPVLLSTLITEQVTNITVNAAVRTGRVGASIQVVDEEQGSDWLPASAAPAEGQVLPGIPADATAVRLIVHSSGDQDADLKVGLATETGTITPAGFETLHVKSGTTSAADLGDITKGEASSLVLSPVDAATAAPVVATLRVTRGKGADQETAFIPATAAIAERATIADNRAKETTLSLVAPAETTKVKITTSATDKGGEPVTEEVTVKGGTTLAMKPPKASGSGNFAVTVVRVSGGPVHASRMLAEQSDGIPMFTIQTMPDDRGTVAVPSASEDLTILD